MVFINFLLALIAATLTASHGLVSTVNGDNKPGARIVKGQNAHPGQFPWQTWVECIQFNFRTLSCGGSLITDRHVLTAAHCVTRVILCKATLGLVSIAGGDGISSYEYPTNIAVYPSYSKMNYANDIALIRLKETVPISVYIRPIRLPKDFQNSKTLSGEPAVISGWGKTRDDESTQHNYLQYATVKIMSENSCKRFFMKNFNVRIDNGHICTDFSKSNVCNGDSGGPLAIREYDKEWTLIGIVSLGISPCEGRTPSVFTAVANYLQWIYQNTQR